MTRSRGLWLLAVFVIVLAASVFFFDGGMAVRRAVGSTYGPDGRLTFYLGKTRAPCPAQEDTTAVILALGQSNMANHAEQRMPNRHPGAVLNYAAGECFNGGSPLLGASGDEGEFLTPLADRLIDSGIYKTVILAPFAVGSTEIGRWRRGGDLNTDLLSFVKELSSHYWVTQVLWQQGESDVKGTSSAAYIADFDSLMASLMELGVRAPVFVAISTHCGEPWNADNPVARAQRRLIERDNIHPGADTDRLLTAEDRRDGCHMKASGQEKTAAAYADSIAHVRKGGP